MIRRHFLQVFVFHAMLVGLVTPVFADDDDDDDDDDQSGDSGGNGGGDDDDDDDEPGQPPAPPPAEGGSGSGLGPSEQDDALEAVQLGLTLPLAVILGRARRQIDGEVIDARLIRTGSALIYELKVLDPRTQTVRRYYYDARSGTRVEVN